MNNPIVAYIWSDGLIIESDRLPAVPKRASMVDNLMQAYKVTEKVKVVQSKPATYQELREFHSELYLDHLKTIGDIDDEYPVSSIDEEYGIGYDCQPVPHMFELVSTIAGGSITAAKTLVLGVADVAINWCGGWHHANRFGAEGFCYVNDIVIAIESLLKKFSKVLYIDLDVHHGNGVEDAYSISKKVFTLSFHKHEPGFYPGTGALEDIGCLYGKGFTCNFPLSAGYSDDTMNYAFSRAFPMVYNSFEPEAIVIQCGADALAGDPHGGANLTSLSYCNCVRQVLDKRKPTMLVAGGGYNHANAARLWTSITALVTGVQLDDDIPEHDNWPQYGPSYVLSVQHNLIRDANKRDYLDRCLEIIRNNLNTYVKPVANPEEPECKKFKSHHIINVNERS